MLAALQASEPSLTFLGTTVASTGPKKVSVDTADANTWYAAVLVRRPDTCFFIKDSVAASLGPAPPTPRARAASAPARRLPTVD